MILTSMVLIAVLGVSQGAPALALEAIAVNPETKQIEITGKADYYKNRGDRLQVDTVPGRDGLSARIVISAATSGTDPNWIVFALRNDSNTSEEYWLVASRYNIVGSGAIWPNLDARRIEAVTPSLGVIPVRVKNDQKDVFSLTLPPGKTITFVAELASRNQTRVFLWKPLAFTQKTRDVQLFNGIMLGIVGLLGIFLTAVFAANHKVIFPSAALMAWCVLAYLCVEFGFWHKLFQLHAEDNAMYRAASESAVAASLVIFLFAFLRLSIWHGFVRLLFSFWIAAQLGLVFAAVLDPQLASTFARLSFVAIGGLGGLLALFLAIRGQDRALSLLPTWLLFGVWIFGMAMAVTGRLSGDVAASALIAGLVLFVLLIGFTVTQFAFRSVEPVYGAAPNQLQLRSLAIDGSGAAVWEWNARRDEIKVSPVVEALLGLNEGELSNKVDNFVTHLHPSDKERFRLTLFSAKETAAEYISVDFRMRHVDNSYRWFELEAASVPGVERKSLRCVGLMRDITETRRSQERLMHDAVHDSLTGLPNRELFLDRLGVAVTRAASEPEIKPAMLFIDIDKFKSINSSFGLIVGDSLLLTVARRLGRSVLGQDTLARVGGDQFAILLPRQRPVVEILRLADEIRHALRAPINIAGQEIILTVSMGLSLFDSEQGDDLDLLRDAEIAMYRAKRSGSDRIQVFKTTMRGEKDDRIAIESDLRRAIANNQLKLQFQPIIHLATEELAGFEALVRWQHPKLGLLNPAHFIPVAEETDLISLLGSFVLTSAAKSAARWHKELPRPDDPLFVSVNVSSRQLFRQDLIQEMRNIVGRAIVPKGALRLEVTETLVMENPEAALRMLELLKEAGAGLSLDDFGTGYSSMAYLQRFPFDTIKIDKALVQGSGDDGPEAVIVRSIVALAHELGKKVVAEGVEVSEDVGFLRSISCAYAQGFYYGEAMSEREVIQLLRMIRKSERRSMRGGLFKAKVKKKLPISPPASASQATGIAAKGTAAGPAGRRPEAAKAALSPQRQASSQATGLPDAANGLSQPASASDARSANAGAAADPTDAAAREAARAGASAPGQENWLKRREALSQLAQSAASALKTVPPAAQPDAAAITVTVPAPVTVPAQVAVPEPAPTPTPPADRPAGAKITDPGRSPQAAASPAAAQTPGARPLKPKPGRPDITAAGAGAAAGKPKLPRAENSAPPSGPAVPRHSVPRPSVAQRPQPIHTRPEYPAAQSPRPIAKPGSDSKPAKPALADFKTLPPGIAASLARLAGTPQPPDRAGDSNGAATKAEVPAKNGKPRDQKAPSKAAKKIAKPPPVPGKKAAG